MQETTDNRDLDIIPDEELFHRGLAQIESFGKITFQIATRQRDLLISEREHNQREVQLLRKRISEKDVELERLRKSLIDFQMQLSESRRNENSRKLEAEQLQEQVVIYHIDAQRIEDTEKLLQAEKDENSALRVKIENMNTQSAKILRDHKAEIDQLILKYEQEKVALYEAIQVAEDKTRNAAETVERVKALASLAEKDKAAALEEAARCKREQKQETDRLQSEVARLLATVSEQERRYTDVQRDCERKITLARSQADQTYQAQVEQLKNALEDKIHEMSRFRYQIEQMKEDHRRDLEAVKADMQKKIELRADEIRRQFILKSAANNDRTRTE